MGSFRVEVRKLPADVTRVVALGDCHGDIAGVRQVLEREDGPGSFVLSVGDVIGYADGPRSSELCKLLEERDIPAVRGNHEDWLGAGGTLFHVRDRRADPRLSASAAAWVRDRPDILRLGVPGPEALEILVIHCHRSPSYRDVDGHNLGEFLEEHGRPRLILVGHSHRPRFLELEAGPGRAGTEEAFAFPSRDELVRPLPARGSLVVDAGSVGYPQGESRVRTPGFGTYAVIDLAGRRAHLRRVVKT